MFHLVQLLAGESVNHIIKTTCHKKIALEASWIAHSWNKVQEFSASVEEADNWNLGTWLDGPPLILAFFIAFMNSLFDS